MKKLMAVAAFVAICASASYADDAKPVVGSRAMPAPIVFFDVAGPDAAKLNDFYAKIFGWRIDANNGIDTGALKGTIRQDPPEKIIYMGVPDINAALEQIKTAGGTVDMPRTVVPNVVTFALFKDPAGNRLGLVELKP
jgi:predicted enzyme related to lactoylglutathione lyase